MAIFVWSASKLYVYRSSFMYIPKTRNLLVSQQFTYIYILDYQLVTTHTEIHQLGSIADILAQARRNSQFIVISS